MHSGIDVGREGAGRQDRNLRAGLREGREEKRKEFIFSLWKNENFAILLWGRRKENE